MNNMVTFLARYTSDVVAWVQRLFLPISLTLQPVCHSGTYGMVFQPVRTPAMLVASDIQGRVSFFVPEL